VKAKERIWTTQLAEHVGEQVRLMGWLHHYRQLGEIGFIILRDKEGLAQIVSTEYSMASESLHILHESVISVEGRVVAEAQAPGGFEVHDPRIEVISPSVEAPIFDLFRPQIKAHPSTILDHAALSLRHPKRRAMARLASASIAGFRSALSEQGFVEIQTPKIVASATEGGANVFKLDYFGRPAYLAQSPQFYKQTMVGVFERVFEVGPVFRAEPHSTPRHLNEYVSLDAEMGFIENHQDVMSVLTEVVRGMAGAVAREKAALALAGATVPQVPATIPVIHFTEAKLLYIEATGEDVSGEPDLSPSEETWLGGWVEREHGSEFLFVWGYPMVKRPFYTYPDPQRPDYSNGFDLLFRGLEIVTGGQRLHRYEDYLRSLEGRGLSPEPFEGYLEAFKYGMPPHGGFAIGLERWVARLVGAANIRETALFPRDYGRLTP
jgi:nondiscriminating aspartyl-tRNA synthetase